MNELYSSIRSCSGAMLPLSVVQKSRTFLPFLSSCSTIAEQSSYEAINREDLSSEAATLKE